MSILVRRSLQPHSLNVSDDGSFRVVGHIPDAVELSGSFVTRNCDSPVVSPIGFAAYFSDVAEQPVVSCVAPVDTMGEVCFNDSVRVPDGRIVAVGSFNGTVSLGMNDSVTSAGGYDAIVVILDAEGDPLWHGVRGGAGHETAAAIAAGQPGELLITGGNAAPVGDQNGATTAFVQILQIGDGEPHFTSDRSLIHPPVPNRGSPASSRTRVAAWFSPQIRRRAHAVERRK